MLRVVIIGGVAAGMSTAAKLRRNMRDGAEITVYEKGGDVSYGACGIPFYVAGRVKNTQDLVARSAEAFRESGIDVKLYHEVTTVDIAAKTVAVQNLKTGESFTKEYDKLVVGSGARPNLFPPFDIPRKNLLSVRNLLDARRLREALEDEATQNVLVVGGGFIGLEIVEACAAHGKNLTLVELAPRILSVMDAEVAVPLEEELRAQGIAVKTACRVTSLVSEGDTITAAKLDLCGESETISCDLVINCAGITPVTGFIAGVDKLGHGAILVDENMRTSQPDVFAAGDCSAMRSAVTGEYQYAPLGTNANKQGRIIADVISGRTPPPFGLIGSSALRLFGLDAAKVGLSEEDAIRLGAPYKTSLITGNSYAGYYDTAKVTIKLVYEPDSLRLLGAQLVGGGTVVPRANYYAIAIANGMSADAFGFMDLCYSPPFSGVWDVALIAANTCK